MEVEEIQHSLIELPPPKSPRSQGLHVSNIIRCIATETGILKGDIAEDFQLTDVRTITDPIAILRISLGLAWEEWYIPQLKDVVDHPGQMQYDGVYMTHDGESLDTVFGLGTQLVLHEVKATYKSTKTVGDLRSQWMWLAQMKAYCKALDTRFAKLHVLFLCGDYKSPITPQLRVYKIKFEQEEIDDNWSLLMQYSNNRIMGPPEL